MDEQFIKKFHATHVSVWNEKNREKREILLNEIYSESVKMYDKDFILHGNNEISDFIDKLLSDPEFYFSATKPAEMTQDGIRLFWNIKTSQGDLTGMDFFILSKRKAEHLYVFMDSH